MDLSWMDHRVVNGEIFIEYKEGVEYFCDFIFKNAALLHQSRAHCPCNRYGNREIFDRDIINIYCIRVDLCPIISIGTYIERHGRKLQGLEPSRTWT